MKNKKVDFAKLIAKNNREFNKASRKRKRLIILEDVLKQIKNNQIEVEEGDYINLVKRTDEFGTDEFGNTDELHLCGSANESLQEKLLKGEIKCGVCARGAMVLSRIRMGNKIDRLNLNSYSSTSDKEVLNGTSSLEGIFEPWELGLIEAFFERDLGFAEREDSFEYLPKEFILLRKYYEEWPEACNYPLREYLDKYYPGGDDEKLVKICKNIIWAEGNVVKGLFRYPWKKLFKKAYEDEFSY